MSLRKWCSFTVHGLPWWLTGKEPACQSRRHETQVHSWGWGDPPGEGNGIPLQYFCYRIPWRKGAWRSTVHGAAESDMIEQLSKLCDGPVNKKLLKYEKKNKNLESLRNLALKQVTHREWRTRDPGQRTNIPYTKKKKIQRERKDF